VGEPADADGSLEALAARAVGGDGDALAEVCAGLQDLIYALALRFTSDPHEAEDATQDVLIQVITNLGRFEGRSRLTTWVYTVAFRHLLRRRRGHVEASVAGPEPFADWLDTNLAAGSAHPAAATEAEYRLLAAEVRLACTYGMLLTLSRMNRAVYLLGDLIGFTDVEGADVLGLTPAAFRQRLARARSAMRGIVADRCGLIAASNPCRCERQIAPSIAYGILDPDAPQLTRLQGADGRILDSGTIVAAADQLDAADAIAAVYRTDPAWRAPPTVWRRLQDAMPDLLGAP
jgi:RNA polymerase sigma factor (sigma-70 family)